ncbi:MAG: hypothetical protein KJ703_02725 [Alphaproteobacteria bacterium]|nr:hypothetical protein [Alphaproteobacteria bacterium]
MASIGFLLAQFDQMTAVNSRFLIISVALEKSDQDQAIAAVGACTKRFRVNFPADGFLIAIPIEDLETKDFVCLTEGLVSVRHTTFIRAEEVI